MGEQNMKTGAIQKTSGTHLRERCWVDTDRECADMCKAALELNAIGHGRQAENAGARRQEMPRIIVRMEAQEI